MCAVKYIIPLKGGEGLVSAGIILVERDAGRAIEFNSPDRPAASGARENRAARTGRANTLRRGSGCRAAGAHFKPRLPGLEVRDYLLAEEAQGVEHLLVLRRPDGAQ